ncbi:MAG TPA: arylamine N-acetyltransferase [Bryobacteraceae bacterium]
MTLDLPRYGARIGYSGGWSVDLKTLRNVHLAHATSIPFENLDVLLGRPVRLDLQSLWAKLVEGGRGGYCFEQNALLAAVLEEVGFRVTRLAARVRMGATGVRPRSHMLLAVEAEGEEWIADVGFGGMGLLRPIRLRGGEVEECLGWRHRVAVEGDLNVLQAAGPTGDWVDQYAFTLEPQYPVDYEVSNHFTSTYPESIFRKMLMVQKAGECRVLLQNRRLIEQRPEGSKEAAVEGDEGLREVLGERFGLWVEEGTRFGVE